MRHDRLTGAGKRILTVCGILALSGAVAVSGIMIKNRAADSGDFAGTGGISYAEDVAKDTQDSLEGSFPQISLSSGDADSLTKDETVYVISDADGNDEETIVSVWLKNPDKLDKITDKSTLSGIENVSGDEQFEKDGSKLTWAAGGKDIKYTGKTADDIPVSCEVSYYLNGEPISASDIAGQSGDVEIHFDYGVNARDRIISGTTGYDLTHPYLMASGAMLDNEHFSDVEVSNGRVLSENRSSICLGVALPGLQDDLAISEDIISIPDSVVIKAKTDCFKIDGTYTVALSGLLEDIDTSTDDISDKFDKLDSAMDKLGDASSKLVKGSKALKKGAEQLESGTSQIAGGTSSLKSKSGDLASAVKKLKKGSGKLSEGTSKVKKGTALAAEGAEQVSDGLAEISKNSEALNAGTKQIEGSVFSSATTQIQAMLKAAGMPDEQVAGIKLEPDTYVSVLAGLKQMAPDHSDAFDSVKESLDSVEKYVAGVKDYTDGVDKVAAGSAKLSGSMDKLKEGAKAVDDGADQIYSGLSKLSGKMPALKKGISKLNSGAEKVDSGAGKLAEGAKEFSGGVVKFDSQGIQKLVDSVDTEEYQDIMNRFEAVSKASGRKHFVGGTPKEIAGESRIIFKTGAVE